MQLNSLHMRVGAMAAGVLLAGLFVLSGGSFGGQAVIQLDFSMYPEDFEGLEVEIDGKVVGALERHGQALRSGFEVSKGEHRVRVLHPELECEPVTVHLDRPGQKARLLMEIQSRIDDRGNQIATIALNL